MMIITNYEFIGELGTRHVVNNSLSFSFLQYIFTYAHVHSVEKVLIFSTLNAATSLISCHNNNATKSSMKMNNNKNEKTKRQHTLLPLVILSLTTLVLL